MFPRNGEFADSANNSEIPARLAPPINAHFRRLPGRLAAITCHFNFCGYRSLSENYFRFAEELNEFDVPLYTAELAFDERQFEIERRQNVVQFRSRDVLWHKERLLNLLLARMPPEFDKVAWIDADLLFENPHWPEDAARLLEEFPVAQLFEEAIYLDRKGRRSAPRMGVARAAATKARHVRDLGCYHPGFAWAARRELLERHGLVDFNIVGGGDSMMVCSMYGWWDHPMLLYYRPAMRAAVDRWGRKFWRDVLGHVGHVPGRVYHLWHGERANRKYVERIDWLNRAEFDPAVDLRLGENGLWEWAAAEPWLRERLRQYFVDRREDA